MKVLDQIKMKMKDEMRGIYREVKPRIPPEEIDEFQNWFWKIRPLLDVNFVATESETTGANRISVRD